MIAKTIVLNSERDVTLTAYLQEVGGEYGRAPGRPAIIVIPGGSYKTCFRREGDPVALGYLRAGFQAFVLHYSLGEHAAWPNPLQDFDQAMEWIRSHAGEWGIYEDKIAVVGFSAGGHLAACAATMSKNRPDAAIIGYGAILGGEVGAVKNAPNAAEAVDGNTCPCFLFTSRTDEVISVGNYTAFMDALDRYDVSFESHIYAYGPHGFSEGRYASLSEGTVICSRASRWLDDSVEWLFDVFGNMNADGMGQPAIAGHVNGDWEDWLSIDCSKYHLAKSREAVEALMPTFHEIILRMKGSGMLDDVSEEQAMELIIHGDKGAGTILRDILGLGGFTPEEMDAIDARLRKIRNFQS